MSNQRRSMAMPRLSEEIDKVNQANNEELEENEHSRIDNKYRSRGNLTCLSCEAGDCEAGHFTLCHKGLRCFTAHVRDADGVIHKSKGCTRDLPHTTFHCYTKLHQGKEVHKATGRSAQYANACCKTPMCNNDTTVWPQLPPVPVIDANDLALDPGSPGYNAQAANGSLLAVMLAVLLPVLFLGLLVGIILLWMRRRHQKRMAALNRFPMSDGDEMAGLRAVPVGDSTLREFREDDGSVTSGSGSGMPFLTQRTLAKQIRLGAIIGKGRYGEVRHGVWNGDDVAVKIFFSRDEGSWKRETDIYTTVLLRHENILGYIGSDFTSVNSCTQLWLITHFHPNGSLYDHLNRPSVVLGPKDAHKIIYTALNGLVHLHTEIYGTRGKPGIAHRDVKSKNILVKNDGSCVIADFGLAVTHTDETGELDGPNMNFEGSSDGRKGTKRYMSPEVLDFSIRQTSEQFTFEAYRRSDIYSFALVMWEVLRRTDLPHWPAEDYALPYHENVGPDPSFDEMSQVVCTEQKRPLVDQRWTSDLITSGMSKLMVESWHQDPSARLSALRLKKSLLALNPEETRFAANRFRTASNQFSGSNGSATAGINPNFKSFSPSGTMT